MFSFMVVARYIALEKVGDRYDSIVSCSLTSQKFEFETKDAANAAIKDFEQNSASGESNIQRHTSPSGIYYEIIRLY